MSRRNDTQESLPAELLLRAYAAGIFPMAESRDDPQVFWVDPKQRGVLPLDRFHISKSLHKILRKGEFLVRANSAFERVLDECAAPGPGRRDTWINEPIREAVIELHHLGFAHSVETWKDGKLVGGLYGVALRGAFFGESMFSRTTNASKVALCHLVARLRMGGFRLLDTQFVTDHLKTFGCEEIPARDYQKRLEAALDYQARFPINPALDLVMREIEMIAKGM
ncbi:MAG TPA: leucyl/phenylalanyl-tRNA--protein transferase [Rhodospirillaceae bacterium]|nr:leucyl/phenylalanyl-tRNA--protein transferase [Rhodospirillaceae bacterium]|tara:strand:- start:85 stop:756 length:672 start_codon:yes stop_codon:yes gene_type:complete